MIPWARRPLEIANLLNPPFCGLLVHEAVRDYHRASGRPMPIPLVHLALPIALHRRTREILPGNTRARMHPWIERHPQARVRFADRVRALRVPVREGLLVAANDGLIHLDEYQLVPTRKSAAVTPTSWSGETESYHCWRAAGFVGRWFAATAGPTTIFALWGLKP